MKKWTQREVRVGSALSPEIINDEITAMGESVGSLSRDQLPTACIDETVFKPYALHRVWFDQLIGDGEQSIATDTGVADQCFECYSAQTAVGGWCNASTTTLTGFKGGNLFIEWSGQGYIYGSFSDTAGQKNTPRYLNLRILFDGVVVAERKGITSHESFRIFGTKQLPAGANAAQFQFQLPEFGVDDALVNTTASHIPQAHVYGQKFFAIGRWR
tara:strand:- start:3369 stop:4013 length:645 start_codon:yes stop_codon:yes gene_type:complete